MPPSASAPNPGPERLITPTFAVIVGSATAYFIAMTMLLPVLPRYVSEELDGNGFQVGMAVGVFAVSAALVRPFVGRLGDRVGRRPLAVAGGIIASLSIAAYGVVPAFAALVFFRLVTGLGEAAFFVGAATAAQDLSPSNRRGEAASFFSVSIYSGLAVGPFLGETLYRSGGAGRVWLVSAGLAALGAVAALWIPASLGRRVGPEIVDDGPRRFLHPAAVMPGSILLLGLIGFAGFTAFLALHLDGLGIDNAGPFFFLYGAAVLVVRIVGARVPDRLGAIHTATISLSCIAVGMVVIAAVSATVAIYAATLIFSLGMALLFPALFSLAVDRAPEHQRSHAVATFSLFFDVSQGIGAPLLGIFVVLSGTNRAAFIAGAAIAVVGLVMARIRLPRAGASTGADPEPGPTDLGTVAD
ncbi:MFS transporter [soil metagenome]